MGPGIGRQVGLDLVARIVVDEEVNLAVGVVRQAPAIVPRTVAALHEHGAPVADRRIAQDPGFQRQLLRLQARVVGNLDVAVRAVLIEGPVGFTGRIDERCTRDDMPARVARLGIAERSLDGRARRDRSRRSEVEQTKGVVADRVTLASDRQRIAAGAQQQAAVARDVEGVRRGQRLRADHRAARAAQRPVQTRLLAERVEQNPGVGREVEGVAVAKSGAVDAAGDDRADLHRDGRGVLQRNDVEAVRRGGARLARLAFDEHGVAAVDIEPQLADVGIEVGRAGDRATERVEQPPVGVAGTLQAVEIEALAGGDAELVGVGLVGRLEQAGNRRARRQLGCLRDVHQAEAVGAGRVASPIDAQRVIAGGEVESHLALAQAAVGLTERPIGDDLAAGPLDRPVHVAAVGQRIEDDPDVVFDREAVAVGLARHVEVAVYSRDDRVAG